LGLSFTRTALSNGNAIEIMNSKVPICGNCGGSEFYSRDIFLMGEVGALLPVGWSPRDVHVRVCGDCGLLEWFAKSSTLEKVKEKFSKD
jgi:predicted nucleic-acid-binding Zn-ribbon protein